MNGANKTWWSPDLVAGSTVGTSASAVWMDPLANGWSVGASGAGFSPAGREEIVTDPPTWGGIGVLRVPEAVAA